MEGCRKETWRCKRRRFNVEGMKSSEITAKWLVKVIKMYRFKCNLRSSEVLMPMLEEFRSYFF